MYLDGGEVDNYTLGGSSASTNNFPLKVGYIHSSNYFPGKIDHVKLYNTALDANAIAADMHNYAMYTGGSVTSSNHVAFYDFNEGDGTTVFNRGEWSIVDDSPHHRG